MGVVQYQVLVLVVVMDLKVEEEKHPMVMGPLMEMALVMKMVSVVSLWVLVTVLLV